MSAALRVAHAAETIRARWERDVKSDPQTEAAQALEDTCQLLDPEVAEELKRLREENPQLRNDITGACLARWEEEQENARLRLALKSAQRGRRELRAQVAELEQQLAAKDRPVDEDPIAYAVVGDVTTKAHAFEREYMGESDAKRRLPSCKVCGRPAIDPAHDEDVTPQVQKLRALLAVQRDTAAAEVDGITRRIAPTQALREDDPFHLHHDYRVGRDLPATGGAK